MRAARPVPPSPTHAGNAAVFDARLVAAASSSVGRRTDVSGGARAGRGGGGRGVEGDKLAGTVGVWMAFLGGRTVALQGRLGVELVFRCMYKSRIKTPCISRHKLHAPPPLIEFAWGPPKWGGVGVHTSGSYFHETKTVALCQAPSTFKVQWT